MDHAEAQEALELAAAQPGGLDRLMAGDTPAASVLAGHLAGCAACSDEIVRLRQEAAVIREAIREMPAPDLRARTLAYVAEVGRPRSPKASRAPDAATAVASPAVLSARPRRADRLASLAAMAAVLIMAVAGTGLVVSAQRDSELAARDAELARRVTTVGALERVAMAALRLAEEPDAQRVALEPGSPAAGAAEASGSLLFSPRSGELLVLASGLPEPESGRVFRCWVEVEGERRSVGRMFFADDLSLWVGPVEGLDELGPGARFGITLVDSEADSLDGDPALSGAL